MRKISVIILSLFLFENALAGGGRGSFLVNFLGRAAKRLRAQENQKAVASLQELETRLWGQSFGDIPEYDVKRMVDSDFKPTDIMRYMENNREEFASRPVVPSDVDEAVKLNVFQKVFRGGHVDSPVFLRWWDHADDFRNFTYTYIEKRHLTGNWELLLRWWNETKLRAKKNNTMETDKLARDIQRSVEDVVSQYPSDFFEAIYKNPFLNTVFRAMNDSDDFADDVDPVLERLFRGYGIEDMVLDHLVDDVSSAGRGRGGEIERHWDQLQ